MRMGFVVFLDEHTTNAAAKLSTPYRRAPKGYHPSIVRLKSAGASGEGQEPHICLCQLNIEFSEKMSPLQWALEGMIRHHGLSIGGVMSSTLNLVEGRGVHWRPQTKEALYELSLDVMRCVIWFRDVGGEAAPPWEPLYPETVYEPPGQDHSASAQAFDPHIKLTFNDPFRWEGSPDLEEHRWSGTFLGVVELGPHGEIVSTLISLPLNIPE